MAVSITFGGQATAAADDIDGATISGLSFGTASANRVVIACIAAQSDDVISSVTIGGITATNLRSTQDTGSTPDIQAHIYAAVVPTGTTGDVVITVPGTSTWSVATFWMTGAAGVSASDTDAATGSAVSISISALTIPTNGAGVATFGNNTDTTATSWTGASSSHDTDAGILRHSSAIITTAGTNTITADGATANQALVGVAWAASEAMIWTKPPMLAHHILR